MAAAALLAVAAAWRSQAPSPISASVPSPPPMPRASNAPLSAQHPADAARANNAVHGDAVAALLQRGSLRGTALDGDWGSWAGANLQPGRALRRRFDYLLTGLGEVNAEQLRPWIAAEVSAQHGDAGAAQVLAVWDAYLRLLQTGAVERLDLSSDEGWRRAMATETTRRNAALGPAWAHAFFADDDREALAALARRSARGDDHASDSAAEVEPRAMALIEPPPAALSPSAAAARDAARVSAFGPDAAARLREQDAAWAAWQQRLADAREALQVIAASSFATATQRDHALDAQLARRFSGRELVRARAMIASDGGASPPAESQR